LVRNGKNTLSWKDVWLYEKPPCVLLPDLFKFCEQQNILVNQVRDDLQSISFTRWLMDALLTDWQTVLDDMRKLNFTSEEDLVSWKSGTLGRFSVKSVYNAMTANYSGPYHRKVWKGKVPDKFIFFSLVIDE